MAGRWKREVADDMGRAAEQFARWRRGRTRGTRIPPELWRLAVELAGRRGVSRVSAGLRVGYYELKKRCGSTCGSTCGADVAGTRTPVDGPSFVELPRAGEDAPPGSETPTGECVLELRQASGARLRLRLPAAQSERLVALARQLAEAR